MSRRALLSPEQRVRLFGIPVDQAEMARHYVLGAEDLALIRTKRRAVNRLGYAIQLCLLRHPGQGLGPGENPPHAMIAFVAQQLAVSPATFADYARRDQTRREHAVELQKYLRLRSFGLADWRACLRVGADPAWATDRGEPIVQAMLDHLRSANLLTPIAAVLERIGLAARARAQKKAFEALAEGLTDATREALDKLLRVDPDVRRSRVAWLRDYSESPRHPTSSRCSIDSIMCAISVSGPSALHGFMPRAFGRLIDEGAVMTAQHTADLEPTRRRAILVAQLSNLETRLADATLATFEKYMGQSRNDRRFQATKRDVAKALILFRRTIAALKQAKQTGEDGVAVVDREVGMKRLDKALPIIGSVADVADQDILVTTAERYSVLRRFSPRFLTAFRFQSSTPGDGVLAAIEPLEGARS